VKLPPLKDLFPFTYKGGGYFRNDSVPEGKKADILHGDQAIQYLYEAIGRLTNEEPPERQGSERVD
jgi:hypothetical protein